MGYRAYSKPSAVGLVHPEIHPLDVALVPTLVPPLVSLKLAGFAIQYTVDPLNRMPSHQSYTLSHRPSMCRYCTLPYVVRLAALVPVW